MPRALGQLTERRDFLRLAAGRQKAAFGGLVLQAQASPDPALAGRHAEGRRIGYTASKKVGGAVVRNRAKRRLRAAAAEILASHGAADHDYVLIARQDTPKRPYRLILEDLERALRRVGLWREVT
jgi:ribonuclease P protein component